MSEASTPHALCKPLPGADQVVGVVRDYNFATPLEVTGVVERLFEALAREGFDVQVQHGRADRPAPPRSS